MYHSKQEIADAFPELAITPYGDFYIKEEAVKDYEIIDFHCHLFQGLKELFPKMLKSEKRDMEASFFDESCFPISRNLFDLNQIYFTEFPITLKSLDGWRAKYKLGVGGFVLKKATPERLLRDMKLNHIKQSVVMQIHPPNKNSAVEMEEIVRLHPELLTFGGIHPDDEDLEGKIHFYLQSSIKGWKLNPHVSGFAINSEKALALVSALAKTGLPILSCSGLGVPEATFHSSIPSKKQKWEMETQRISMFEELLEQIPTATFIFAHAGIYEIDQLIPLMKKYPQTLTDISTQPPASIRMLIDELGSERLLFGTDYPFFNQAFSILSVLRSTDHEQDRKNIFSENARRILQI